LTDSKYKEKIVDIKLSETISGEEAPIDFVVSETDSIPQPSPSPENLESKAFDTSETPPDLGPRYDILGLVGTGGMGTVWKVHDKELGEDFAIKVLKPELVTDETALKRFQKEANLASELTHANIAAIFGPGEDGSGRPYIIMRYVDGESLADILKREGKLSEERAMDIFSQLCEALSHSHMKGIVHRDIKPSNIIISKTESGADLVQLVDFGIARCVYDEVTKTQALTKAVDVFGSPRYMSPEQLLGQEVTGQSDIYSLGIVLYEMLTGEPPFTSDNPIELMIQQISQEPNYSKNSSYI
jgi:Serine/threonine protein kinase